jgi:tetratricopeptide (TPR) repeat protein
MTSKALRSIVFVSSLAAACAGSIALPERDAFAQSEDDLQKARELFNEAFKDEQAGHFDVALEKFRRVAQVKESAQVRYRIATCSEQLNRLREARDAYRACAAMKATLPKDQQNVADACAEKALAIDKKVPKIVVTISGENPPQDARVTVDGHPVPTGRPVEQDPGEHTVQASATGMKPFEQKVTLPDNGSQIPATVAFEPEGPKGPVEDPNKKKGGGKALGWVALVGGGALMIVGGGLLIAREGVIDDIDKLCAPDPNNCNPLNRNAVNDKTDTANLYLPLGIGFMAVGAVAAGFGVYTVFIKKPAPETDPQQPPAQGNAARIDIGPRYVRGGAMLGLTGTF